MLYALSEGGSGEVPAWLLVAALLLFIVVMGTRK